MKYLIRLFDYDRWLRLAVSSAFLLSAHSVLLGVSGVAHGESSAKDNNATIEQAKNALKEAKTALEAAQNSLKGSSDKEESAVKTPVFASNTNTSSTKPKSTGQLYKWVDENGKISYQDSPPPKNVKVINSDLLKDTKVGDKPVKEVRLANEPEPEFDGTQPIMVYTADNCKPCQSVVLYLTQKQVPFIERDIRTDRRARERLSNLSKQITVPSLFIGKRIIQGNSKPMIARALEEAGYLTPQ